MPGVVRIGDAHVGHASPTPSPFHQTSYATGSGNVFVDAKGAVRIGDTTGCGDPAVGSSPDVSPIRTAPLAFTKTLPEPVAYEV